MSIVHAIRAATETPYFSFFVTSCAIVVTCCLWLNAQCHKGLRNLSPLRYNALLYLWKTETRQFQHSKVVFSIPQILTMKRIRLTLFLVLTLAVIGFAQTDSRDVTITASGSGQTLGEATQIALRNATEQAFGAFISSKTEIFNDKVVADQMASVSSGNIKSYDVLNEAQLPDGRWAVTLRALVSVDKLTSFAQA